MLQKKKNNSHNNSNNKNLILGINKKQIYINNNNRHWNRGAYAMIYRKYAYDYWSPRHILVAGSGKFKSTAGARNRGG